MYVFCGTHLHQLLIFFIISLFAGFSYEGFIDAVKVFTPLLALLASLVFVWKILSTLLRYSYAYKINVIHKIVILAHACVHCTYIYICSVQ